MKPTIVQKDEIILVGMSFYGDPFESSAGWTEENQIGRLWQRLMGYLAENTDAIEALEIEHFWERREIFLPVQARFCKPPRKLLRAVFGHMKSKSSILWRQGIPSGRAWSMVFYRVCVTGMWSVLRPPDRVWHVCALPFGTRTTNFRRN